MADEIGNEIADTVSSYKITIFLEDSIKHRLKGTVPFQEIKPFLENRGVIRLLTAENSRTVTLRNLLSKVEHAGKFDFFQTVFSASEIIPKSVLTDLWYACYNDHTSPHFQNVSTPEGEMSIPANPRDPQQLASLSITDPLLIDNRAVILRYCQAEKTGWKLLRYVHGRRNTTLKIPDQIHQSITEDSPESFSMFCCMSRTNLSYSLIHEIMEQGAAKIFGHLLREDKIPEKIISYPELCCKIVTEFKDSVSIPLLRELETVHPGMIRETLDPFGRNLLWYAIQNMETGFFHPNCLLTPFLIEHGCSPDNRNTVGLTWNEILLSLTRKQKQSLMQFRYNRQPPYHGPYGQSLRQLQSLDVIF